MAQRQRIVLVLVFIMGGLVIVAGIARVPSLLRLGTSTDQQCPFITHAMHAIAVFRYRS